MSPMSVVGALMIVVVSAIVSADQVCNNTSSTDDSDVCWQHFKLLYDKRYDVTEDPLRRAIRELTGQRIREHNTQARQGLHSFTLGYNEYSDWTPAEYHRMLGFRQEPRPSMRRFRRSMTLPVMPIYYSTVAATTLPASINWTASGWVGPVLNQGPCGSCWAYSSIGALEAQFANCSKTFVKMSEQNLLDCSFPQGNLGCNGGSMDLGFFYVQTNGVDPLDVYPNVSNITGNTGACTFNSSRSTTMVTSWRGVQVNNEMALQQAVALVGPVSVAIRADLYSFQSYKSGVYDDPNCTANLNHAVLVVGYGTLNGKPYWLIKNSWGTSWGMKGYMMMALNKNMCGIASAATFPVI